ncbi:Flavin-containing monooxygenase-like protein [Macrophomina phaseolina MS6]|uniref:Flavin-containing monooxygenase-like protein n=1 Tax=Macrophomina phaseolina (strain MS6) TaxID=1126212 RepID=K2RTU4_MACPH|nr:Flavin-containing monooxygenase-like protein [Macrophomina phaseolina MS6]
MTQADLVADIIIVGGGFGGCYALEKLRRHGYPVKLLEAGSDFGGVWHFNRYPGARVDSETPVYQLSVPLAWRSFNFRERYPGHSELRAYFMHIAQALDLRKDAIFNAKVVEAKYNSASSTWHFRTQGGLSAESRYAIFAAGTTNKPHIPNFPGLDKFTGRLIHPAAWPDDLNVKGKRVGLVGQGASGVQLVQELAKDDCQLTVFVRTPCTAFPMGQRTLPIAESEGMKNMYDALFMHAKYRSDSGYPYNSCNLSFYEATEEQRKQQYEELWARAGFSILSSNYGEYAFDKTANAELYQFWASKVRSRMSDPIKRDIVAPVEQFQWLGGKRAGLEMDYYEMLDRPNVKLVDLKQTPIKEFTSGGVVTGGQSSTELHDFDIVIVATGYDSVTGSLYEMNIEDKNGRKLQEKWKDGIHTYLGMMVPDVPNAFILYGPQAPTANANGPPFLELQVEWVAKLLDKARQEDVKTVEPSSSAASEWREKVMQAYSKTFARETPSWWNGSNIPGKNKEPLLWFGGMRSWWQHCLTGLESWSSFCLEKV